MKTEELKKTLADLQSRKGGDAYVMALITQILLAIMLIFEAEKTKPKKKPVTVPLVKPDAIKFEVPIDYAGFAVPNHFLIGFGLDYDGLGRNLSDIYKAIEN